MLAARPVKAIALQRDFPGGPRDSFLISPPFYFLYIGNFIPCFGGRGAVLAAPFINGNMVKKGTTEWM